MGNEMNEQAEAEARTPVNLSAEALLELEELSAGIRDDVPALTALFHLLRTPMPSPTFEGHQSVSMLADVRSYSILRDSLDDTKKKKSRNFPEFQQMIESFLEQLEQGVSARNEQKIKEAKRFCLALGENLIGAQMKETYQSREKSDSRYISENAVL